MTENLQRPCTEIPDIYSIIPLQGVTEQTLIEVNRRLETARTLLNFVDFVRDNVPEEDINDWSGEYNMSTDKIGATVFTTRRSQGYTQLLIIMSDTSTGNVNQISCNLAYRTLYDLQRYENEMDQPNSDSTLFYQEEDFLKRTLMQTLPFFGFDFNADLTDRFPFKYLFADPTLYLGSFDNVLDKMERFVPIARKFMHEYSTEHLQVESDHSHELV